MKHKLDRIDRKILTQLQKDARISIADLADSVGLSPTPCARRVRILEENGVIERNIVLLNQANIGLPMTVLVQISLEKQTKEHLNKFENEISQIPEVMECFLITGSSVDYILKIVSPNLEYYQQLLLDKITSIPGISSIMTNFVMRQPIKKTEFSLDHYEQL